MVMDRDALKIMKKLNKKPVEECIVVVEFGRDEALVIRNERNGNYKLPTVPVDPVLPNFLVSREVAEQKTEDRKRKAITNHLAANHGIRIKPYGLSEISREEGWRVEGDRVTKRSVWYLNPNDYTIDILMSLGLKRVKRDKVYESLNLTHLYG
jgi:hypothetical protein